MTAEQWSRIKVILAAALERQPEDRPQFLERECSSDLDLRREVEEFLRYEEAASAAARVTRWREEAAVDASAPGDPERAGPYRIVQRIGEGGMGVVYLAERDDGEYRQRVAVKILKAGPQATDLLRRFRSERQILARLEHPGIARLIDGGTVASGQLYFAMEYVEGVPVTEYASARCLSVRERLRLFSAICTAVSHAHRNLVIHGDLKPGNILVAADGNPKLLDFGLAKVFREDSGADQTAASLLAMTPRYASPEQVRGQHLTTATDVYSLGVLLYEMLSGQGPYDEPQQSPFEACCAICEQEPRHPSAAARGTPDQPARPGEIRGDLDNIVLMALRKEPERRYGSVEEFRQDIERHMEGFPVRASRGTAVYRFRKFVSRHRWGVAVSFLGVLGTIGAATAVWWQGRQAEMRFNDVRQLAHAVVFDLHDAIEPLPGSTAARKLLVERALEYLRRLEASGGKSRELQLELAGAYTKIGEIQGSAPSSLGDTAGALESYGRARQMLKAILRLTPDDERAEETLRRVDKRLADTYERRGDRSSWREAMNEAITLQWNEAKRHPEKPVLTARALAAEALADFIENPEASIPAWKKALAAFKNERVELKELRGLHRNLASAYQQANDVVSALEQYSEVLRLDQATMAAHPQDTRYKMVLAWDLSEVAWIEHARGNSRAAVASFERALALQEELSAADPQDFFAKVEVAKLKLTAAPACEKAGQEGKAITYLRSAITAFESALARDPGNDDTRHHHAWALNDLGNLYRRRHDWGNAAACFERAADSASQLKPETRFEGRLVRAPLLAHARKGIEECRWRLGRRAPGR